MKNTFAILSLALLAPVPAGAKALAHLRAEASVSGRDIHLGDVARITGDAASAKRLASILLGPSPLPGMARGLDAGTVRIHLLQQKLDAAVLAPDSAPSCQVARAAQKVSGDRLLEAARDFVTAQTEAGDGKLVVEPISHPRELTLPVGELKLSEDFVGVATGSSRRVAVSVTVDGEDHGHVDVALRLHRYLRVAVAAAGISRGSAVDAAQVRYEERDTFALPAGTLLESDALDGFQALRPIAAGSPLTAQNVGAPPAIHRGDSVTLRAVTGGIVVTAPGTAMEDGRLGQTIRVRNTNSSQDSRAVVLDAKTVEAPL